MLRQIFEVKGAFSDPGIISIPKVTIPWIESIPVVGEVVSGQNLIIYLTLIATFLVYYLIFKTRFGLRLRAAGYNRTCLDTSGVSATRIRIWSLILCAVLCGLALERGEPGAVYVGCDGHPITRSELVGAVAGRCRFTGTAGPLGRRCDNPVTRRQLGFTPRWSSFLAWAEQERIARWGWLPSLRPVHRELDPETTYLSCCQTLV